MRRQSVTHRREGGPVDGHPDGFSIEVAGRTCSAGHRVIATGSQPIVPPVPGAQLGSRSSRKRARPEALPLKTMECSCLNVRGTHLVTGPSQCVVDSPRDFYKKNKHLRDGVALAAVAGGRGWRSPCLVVQILSIK